MRTCWYCGTTEAQTYEKEHQLPIARGGPWGAGNVVEACLPCNRLKGARSVEQFRLEIECRLGEPVVFAGEASEARAASDISPVRSFAAPTGLVRLPEEVLSEARSAVLQLRSAGYVTTTLSALVSEAIESYLGRLRNGELNPARLGPQVLALFGPAGEKSA